jgi:hypothetical protein
MKRIAVFLLIALVACGDSTGPKVEVSGRWNGSVGGQVVQLTLLESNGTVSGNGTISGTSVGTQAVTVAGVFTNPDFSLTLTPSTARAISFQGKYNGSQPAQLVGTFQGSGFTGEQVILNKQP